jgi:hypothetical protein
MPSVLLNFLSIHVAHRDHPDQFTPDSVGDKEQPPTRGVSNCPITFFLRRVPHVAAYYQWLVKEDVLGLLWRYPMALPVLDSVRFIPIESDTLAKRIVRRHDLYISHIHNYGKISAAFGLVKLLKVLDRHPDLLDEVKVAWH